MTKKTSKLQQWLEHVWYKNGKGRFLLLPLSALYCALNNYQRNKQTKNLPQLPCPIIVVGNITLGGTGKTPLTIYITRLLLKAGYKPAIITRGYGGKATRWPQSVIADTDPKIAGDEAVLMAIRTGVPVYAGADRLQSIRKLIEQHECDVIISDDGMQHYKMPRDIQIAVIDATRMLGNGLCLPAGPLREKKEKLNDCDFVVLNGAKQDQALADNSWIEMQLEGDVLINLKTGEEKNLKEFSNKTVNAVSGIGNPQRFFNTLKQAGLNLHTYSFPDHYDFKETDLNIENDFSIIMTEKDAVKCRSFANKKYWYLPIKASLDKQFDQNILALLKKIVKK